MTTTITSLYKQVFNNKYLNRIIYNYVQYCDNEESNSDDYEKSYYQIINSYNIVDLEIGVLLKQKQYKLLGTMIDNYFKYVSNNQHSYKYWYFMINPTKKDILKLLKWRELGFERFILLYDEFTQLFQFNKEKTLKSACLGGNFQIFQFLLDNGYPLFKQQYPYSHRYVYKFNCGGNLDIFKVIMDSFQKSTFDHLTTFTIFFKLVGAIDRCYKEQQSKNQRYIEFDWISESPSTTFQYYEIYKYLYHLPPTKCTYMAETIYHLENEDLSLGRLIVELMNKKTDGKFLKNKHENKLGIILEEVRANGLIITPGKYNVLAYIFNNLINKDCGGKIVDCKFEDLLLFHSKSLVKQEENKNIYRFNFNCTGIDAEWVVYECYNVYYYPNSIQEFNFIQNNEKLNARLKRINEGGYISKIANKLYDLDYLKLIFQYYFKDEIANGNFEFIKPFLNSLLGSTFEIVSWVLESFIYHSGIHYRLDINASIYQGDIRIFKLLLPYMDNPKNHYNLDDSISNGYYDMFVYAMNIKINRFPTEENDGTLSFLHETLSTILKNNQFQMYKYLLDTIVLSTYANEFVSLCNNLVFHPLYLAYFINKFNNNTSCKPFYPYLIVNGTRECILKSIFLIDKVENNYLGCSSKPIIKMQVHSTKVLDYLISNKTISAKTILNNKKTVSFLIGNSLIKKFIYFLNKFDQQCISDQIQDDDDGYNSLMSIISYGFIIKKSISTNNYLILNCIINLKSSNGDNGIFKNQFYLYFLLYSILLVNRNNSGKFNSIGNSLISNSNCQIQLYNYYSTILDTDKFNLDFSNLINFKDQFESQLLYLDNLSIHIKRNEYKTSKSLYNLVVNNLNLFIITQQQQQHSNNNFINFLINLKHSLK